MHEALIQQLIEILQNEYALFGELGALVEQEREAFERMDHEAIISLSNRKDTTALKLKALEESRSALVKKFAAVAGSEPAGMTISRIAELAGGAQELLAAGARLREIAEPIQKNNSRNALLAEYSLSFIDHLLQQIRLHASGERTYYERNRLKNYSTPGRFVHQRM